MTFKIGLVGCGDVATNHVAGYLTLPNEAYVAAVSDVVTSRAQYIAQALGGRTQIFTDFRALLHEAEIDAVDICLPHFLHTDAIVAAAMKGKHILCEKPLCLTSEEAAIIRQVVMTNGITFMCAHNLLFSPAVKKAKELLAEGILGRIYELRVVDIFRHLGNTGDMGWRVKKTTMGGGELIDTGYHPSYLLYYLTDSSPIEVTAIMSTHRLKFIEGEDSAQVLVRFADGSLGNIMSSWAYDLPVGSWQLQVNGELGQIYGRDNILYLKMNDDEPSLFTFPPVNTYREEIADFLVCLRNNRRPIHNEIDGMRVLQLILTAYQSQIGKRTILLGGAWED
jgi:predicted dehydrogenase